MSIPVTSVITALSDLRHTPCHREAATRTMITRISTIAMRMPMVVAAPDDLSGLTGGPGGVGGLGASGLRAGGLGAVGRTGGPAEGGS